MSIQLLSPGDIDEAYVLARLSGAGMTLKAWRAKVLQRNASPATGGVLLARDLKSTPCGLVVYNLTDQLDGRRSLEVETLIGFDVLDPGRIASALVIETVRLARAVGCETLCLMRPLGQSMDVAAEVLATGIAVLPSLFWSAPPAGLFDVGQRRGPSGSLN